MLAEGDIGVLTDRHKDTSNVSSKCITGEKPGYVSLKKR